MNPNHFRSHPALFVLLLALLLPLLAACAGAAPSQTASFQTNPAPTGAAPASAPAAEKERPTNLATPAPAATAAPASLEGGVGSAPAAEPGASAADTGAPVDPPAGAAASERPRPQGQVAPLKAGEVDDNARFAEYLDYLASYSGPPACPVDVSERYLLTVRDGDQRPLLDARVTIYAGEQPVFRGRTYAGGQTLFLPSALGVAADVRTFRVVAEQGGGRAETTFARDTATPIELAIRDAQPLAELRLDLLFLLDTTGSMADELQRIQTTIDDIAQRIDAFQPRPALRFGLVAYRDHGDDYVTRSYDFTPDVGAFRQVLGSLTADGGGDTPEALDEALHDAVRGVAWADDAVRLVFLVADAAPHIEAQAQVSYVDEVQAAVERGLKIYPIAASNTDPQAEYVFRQLAQQTLASFIFLTYQPGQSGGAPGESTTLEAGQDQQYTVERLDDLIVQVVERELAAAVGAR